MNIVLKVVWVALLLLSLGATLVFVQGIRRDHHAGDPDIALDLSQRSDWSRQSFRVGKTSQYTLWLSSVNHAPPFGNRYAGTFDVRITDPTRARVFSKRFAPNTTDHVRPDNMHWATLARLTLAGRSRGWALETRVVEPDSAFEGVSSRITLRRERYDPGMGGLVNYVMPIPAIAFALLSLLVAFLIARRGDGRFAIGGSILVLLGWLTFFLSRGFI